MRRTPHCSAAAGSTVQFIAPPGPSCSLNAGLSTVVGPAKRKLLADIVSTRFVIHTVGPVWRGGKHHEPETLANCYRNSLQLALENEIKTIAFPAISCGAYGYPILDAAQVALKTARDFLATDDSIDKVTFVLWGEDIYEAYRQLL